VRQIILAAPEIPLTTEDRTMGISLNGPGNQGHEAFHLGLLTDSNKTYSCPTEMKPYDIIVMAALLRASVLAGSLGDSDGIVLGSDGDWDVEWLAGRALYDRVWPEDNMFGEDIESPLRSYICVGGAVQLP
jgi:hypothetical protein